MGVAGGDRVVAHADSGLDAGVGGSGQTGCNGAEWAGGLVGGGDGVGGCNRVCGPG